MFSVYFIEYKKTNQKEIFNKVCEFIFSHTNYILLEGIPSIIKDTLVKDIDNKYIFSYGDLAFDIINDLLNNINLNVIRHIKLPEINKLISSPENKQIRVDTFNYLSKVKEDINGLKFIDRKFINEQLPKLTIEQLYNLHNLIKESTEKYIYLYKNGKQIRIVNEDTSIENNDITINELITLKIIMEVFNCDEVFISNKKGN